MLGSLLLMALLLNSCGSKKAKDINIDDLDSACEFVDALEIVADEMIAIKGSKSMEELSETEKADLEALGDKLRDIDRAAGKKFEKEEAEKCGNFKTVEGKFEKIEDF